MVFVLYTHTPLFCTELYWPLALVQIVYAGFLQGHAEL